MVQETELLSPDLWSRLPDVLIGRVLQSLPFPALVACRVVCRTWNNLITSPGFASTCAKPKTPKGVPILVAEKLVRGKGAIYYEDFDRRSWGAHSLAVEHSSLSLTACSGGLMCFETEDRQLYVICNPLTRKSSEVKLSSEALSCSLSQLCGSVRRVTGLVVCKDTGNFKLVVGYPGDKTFVYESAKRAWKVGAEAPHADSFGSPGAVTCNGAVYCSVKQYEVKEEKEFCTWSVLKYNLELNTWSKAFVETRSVNDGSAFELLERSGKVMVVAKVPSRMWMPSGNYYFVWYNSFFTVSESSPDMEVVEDAIPRSTVRKIFQTMKDYIGLSLPSLPCTFAGHEEEIYVTHQDENDEKSVVHVAAFNANNPNNYRFSPSFVPEVNSKQKTNAMGDDVRGKYSLKIWTLEPSLTASV